MSRTELDHFRAKPETVELGDKEYTVKPMKNGELLDFVEDFEEEWEQIVNEEVDGGIVAALVHVAREKPAQFIDRVVKEKFTQDDWLNAYPNDIYRLVVIFKDVNFTFVNKIQNLWSKVVNMTQQKAAQKLNPQK